MSALARRLRPTALRALWALERRLWTSDLERLRRTGRVVVGRHSYGEPRVLEFGHDRTRLVIGNYCSLARDSMFVLGGNHRIDTVTTFPLRIQLGLAGAGSDGQPWSKGDIVVGSDVWVGARATVISGVTIGHGAVIAAGAVVTRDVPPFAVVGGNPAVELRRRFDERRSRALLDIAWWDWEDEAVRSAVGHLASTDVDRFIETFGTQRATT
ncbi:CatB-related O-acetyltransferase [Actinomycetospora sp. C-140]